MGRQRSDEMNAQNEAGQAEPIRGVAGGGAAREPVEVLRQVLAAIVESSDDAIIGKTLDGVITSWNRGAERIFGYAADEIIGKNISILKPPEHSEDVIQILQQIRHGEHV